MRRAALVSLMALMALIGGCNGAVAVSRDAGRTSPDASGSVDATPGDGLRDAWVADLDARTGYDSSVVHDASTRDLDSGTPSPRDSGTPPLPDSGTPPDGGAPGSPGCAGRDVLFCDDFEGGSTLDTARWTSSIREATVAVTDSMTFEGRRALHLHLNPADGARVFLNPSGLFPLRPNRFYMRFYVRASAAALERSHTVLMNAYDTSGRGFYYGIHMNSATLNSRYVAPDITMHGGLRYGSTRMPADRWQCFELLFDGENDSIRVWLDGTEDTSMRVGPETEPPWPAPTFARMDFGFLTHQALPTASDMWYDAVIIDDERIGCD